MAQTKTDITPNSESKRVAVIGARGIGKHHAHWWHREGANVCAVVASCADTLPATVSALQQLFLFSGKPYTSVEEMLAREKPDIVDVCTPPARHYEHVLSALNAGCSVQCEKPFVYDPNRSRQQLLDMAVELLDLAEQRNLRLSVSTQYAVAAPMLASLRNRMGSHGPISSFASELAAPARGRPPEPERTWIDLSPHPLSVLLHLFPDGRWDADSFDVDFHENTAEVEFTLDIPSGRAVTCKIRTRNTTEQPSNIRRFELNGMLITVDADKDADGVYCNRIVSGNESIVCDDFLRQFIRQYLTGNSPVDRTQILCNLDLMTAVLEKVRSAR